MRGDRGDDVEITPLTIFIRSMPFSPMGDIAHAGEKICALAPGRYVEGSAHVYWRRAISRFRHASRTAYTRLAMMPRVLSMPLLHARRQPLAAPRAAAHNIASLWFYTQFTPKIRNTSVFDCMSPDGYARRAADG